ncbi:Intraflagellar transport protein IFT46/ FAP32 [Giardia muris]|uniref:Intraflagellar transport protein IFT46/ FAP32 n=1 Tax=Giardia muris TaxID=5742 RepID=A0A4Z1T8Y8_GIAMU|nr:Intraflagellar transport protein IFT46/ FAP32 [Giardia muris]|eukprot:TNJ28991.1 Intraflagellar transport protein IFT46/ FAP32 [Giardia muris]
MFKNRKSKKGRADETLEYQGMTSLESNAALEYQGDANLAHGQDDFQGEVEALSAETLGSTTADPSIVKLRKGLTKTSEKELLNLFRAFQPVELSLETIYVPFVSDYTPSIGDVDPFIKVPRPDNKVEPLGLVVLDDPCLNQTDATVLQLQLQSAVKGKVRFSDELGGPGASSDTTVMKDPNRLIPSNSDPIKQVTNTKKNVDQWIAKIDELHQRIGGTSEYNYRIAIPENIMHLWEPQFLELLERVRLPTADIDLTTEEYARVICAILDIPVGESIIESLHMLFTNYMDIQDSIKLAQRGLFQH